MMRVVTTGVAAALAVAGTAAPAVAAVDRNPNAFTITLQCPQGTLTGTTAGGGALLLEGGGVAVLQGLVSAAGDVIVPVNPGLDRSGRLVSCTYDSPNLGEGAVASVLFP